MFIHFKLLVTGILYSSQSFDTHMCVAVKSVEKRKLSREQDSLEKEKAARLDDDILEVDSEDDECVIESEPSPLSLV